MYLLGEPPGYADALAERLQHLLLGLLDGLPAAGASIRIEDSDDVLAELPAGQLFLVQSGLLHVLVDERPLIYLQEGDLLGLRQDSGRDGPAYRYSCDEPVELLPYDRHLALRHIHTCETRQDQFTQYLIGQADLLSSALARLRQPEIRPISAVRHFRAGEELIREGDDADDVFIIIDGHAEAFVNGQKVGDVQKDEIFGAMAVFTHEKRSAAVIASAPGSLMVIPKKQFLALMQGNPRIAHSLIESMARRIDQMNKEITRLRLPMAG
ncbi:Crp/Fnr family transcriptional regulator [Stutzerimonas tarimensis]|uniref:Crp/Fnr family transcriptional regulator n=1 Tax=Stutzerimonas tarimensis TaxID=1507735 RepID=A0ABV7T3S1_9GAMM